MSKKRIPGPQKFLHFKVLPSDKLLIEKLVPAHQAVLLAKGSYGAIQKTLGINPGTLRSRLNRARAALVKLRERAQQ